MSQPFTAERFLNLGWGPAPAAMPEALEDAPSFGEIADDQMRKVRAPVRIRLDGAGGLVALADGPARTRGDAAWIFHFDPSGKLVRGTRIPAADPPEGPPAPVVDFLGWPDGSSVLLERVPGRDRGSQRNRLRRVDASGGSRWVRTGDVSRERTDLRTLEGDVARLLTDGRSLYVAAAGPPDGAAGSARAAGSLAEIDVDSGAVSRTFALAASGDELFMDAQGLVHAVTYFPEIRRRGIARFAPGGASPQAEPFGVEAFGWLINPLGVDAGSNLYAWKDGQVARIAPTGAVTVIGAVTGAAVDPRGVVWTGSPVTLDDGSPALEVRPHRAREEAAGTPTDRRVLRLRVQDGTSGARPGEDADGWRLVHVDDRGRFHLFGGERPGHAGELRVYSTEGHLEEGGASPPAHLVHLESRLANHRLWIVDPQGRIYVPMTAPDGFNVLRLSR